MPTPTVPTTPAAPCPPWCRRPTGHGLSTRAGAVRRVHLGRRVVVLGVGAVELEQVDTARGPVIVEVGPVQVVTDTARIDATHLQVLAAGLGTAIA